MPGPTANAKATGTDTQFHTPVSPILEDSNDWAPPGHNGVDLICNPSSTLYAVCRAEVIDARSGGWWSKGATGDISRGDGVIRLRSKVSSGILEKGMVIGYGHAESPKVHVGQVVEPGQVIGKAGFANAWHVHFFMGRGDARDGEFDPMPYINAFRSGTAPTGQAAPGAGGPVTGDNTSTESGFATAFATFFDLPGILNYAEAVLMTGDKSIYNDEPLLPFVQELTKASMRHFQSLPNGSFYAFFPDQFGAYGHRKPYWEIDDIEVLDGKINLTDDALSTHVFIAGDTNLNQEVDLADRMASKGVITIYDAFVSKMFTQDVTAEDAVSLTDKLEGHNKAIQFLKRYGVRPLVEPDTFIRNGFFEVFYAFTRFMQQWSSQFATSFDVTFMPELYPGGIVGFKKHGIQCYVESVTHTFDYTSGFTTQAVMSSPAAYGSGNKLISQGMIRPVDKQIAAIPDDIPQADDEEEDKKKPKPTGTPMGGPR